MNGFDNKICQKIRRPTKSQFGGLDFVSAIIVSAVITHGAGCNILSHNNCIQLYLLFLFVCFFWLLCFFFLYVVFLFCSLSLIASRNDILIHNTTREPIRMISINRRNKKYHVAEKKWQDLRIQQRTDPCAILMPEENGKIHHAWSSPLKFFRWQDQSTQALQQQMLHLINI